MNPIQYMMQPPPPPDSYSQQTQDPIDQKLQQQLQQLQIQDPLNQYLQQQLPIQDPQIQQQQHPTEETPVPPVMIKTTNTFDYIFKPSTLLAILWFFLLYILCFVLLRNAQASRYTFSKTVDLVVCFLIFIALFFVFFFVTPEQRLSILKAASRAFFDMLNEPITIVPILFAMVVFYLCVFFLNLQSNSKLERSIFMVSVESILWILLVLMIIIDFFKIVLHIDAVFNVKEMVEGLDMMSFLPPIN